MVGVLVAIALVCGFLNPSLAVAEAQSDTKPVAKVSVEEFDQARRKDNTVVIDVRSPDEFAAGRIPDAVNVPVSGAGSEAFEKRVAELTRGKTALLYCRSGTRSARAAEKMQAMGIKPIIEFPGGWVAWTKAEKPVEKGPRQSP